MVQRFVYREVEYSVGDEIAGRREWFIGPETERLKDGHHGVVSAAAGPSTTVTGTFRRAVLAAWEAIDKMLDSEMTPKPS